MRPANARSEHHRQVDDVRAGQEMTQREGFVERLGRHPAVLIDDATVRPDQHAAKPASDISAEATNSAIRLGGGNVESSSAPMAAGGHPGGMPKCPAGALFFSTFAPYIGNAGSPAMEINCRRNKPFGPGGSTRRLHPSPPRVERVSAGAKQDRRGRKGRVFSRYGSAVIGLCNSCKRQLCSGCSGRVSGLKNQV